MHNIFTKLLLAFFCLHITAVFANASPRIVAIGGGVTETIYALHAEKDLVGVDISSTWPIEAKKLPQVGYQRTLAAEGILALKPTLMIGTQQSGPEAALEQLRKAGVEVVVLPSTFTIETVKTRLKKIAVLVGKESAGKQLWQKVETDLIKAKEQQKNIKEEKHVLFLLTVPGRAPLAAGKNTEADTIVTLSKAKNVITEFEGYRVLSPEAIQTLNPDVIVVTTDGAHSANELVQVTTQAGVQHTKAAKENAIISMDTNLLLNMGPRFGEAVLTLTDKLYK